MRRHVSGERWGPFRNVQMRRLTSFQLGAITALLLVMVALWVGWLPPPSVFTNP